jgi:hypothetical protein
MPMHDSRTRGSWEVDIYDTPAELDPAEPVGQLALVLDPLTLYVFTASGYQVLGAGEAAPASTPASEAGQGVVELATEAEVQGGTAGVLVATVARLQAELDRRGGIAATESALGPVELATEAEVQGGTAGALVASAARLKAELDRRATVPTSVAPTLTSGWVHSATYAPARYYKHQGLVHLEGVVADGTDGSAATIFTLPAGYRPANSIRFNPESPGTTNSLIIVQANGRVIPWIISNTAALSLSGIYFRAEQ